MDADWFWIVTRPIVDLESPLIKLMELLGGGSVAIAIASGSVHLR